MQYAPLAPVLLDSVMKIKPVFWGRSSMPYLLHTWLIPDRRVLVAGVSTISAVAKLCQGPSSTGYIVEPCPGLRVKTAGSGSSPCRQSAEEPPWSRSTTPPGTVAGILYQNHLGTGCHHRASSPPQPKGRRLHWENHSNPQNDDQN